MARFNTIVRTPKIPVLSVHVPAGFDPRDEMPAGVWKYKDQILLVVSEVASGCREDGDGWTSLSSVDMEDLLGSSRIWSRVREAFMSRGVLECDGRRIIGRRCYGYRLGPRFAYLPLEEVDLFNEKVVEYLHLLQNTDRITCTPDATKAYCRRSLTLRLMGFQSYSEYRDSDTWKSIRESVLAKSDGRCYGCGKAASEVHHGRYEREDLEGSDMSLLFAVCRRCHGLCEFRRTDASKVKVSPEESVRRLEKIRAKNAARTDRPL